MEKRNQGLVRRGTTMWWVQVKKASGEINAADILILDFQPSELWKNLFLLFKPSKLYYFVMASLAF